MDSLQIHTQDEVDQIIGNEDKGRLFTCYEVAWQRWEDMSPGDRKDIVARTRAGLVHDYAAAQAIKEFDGLEPRVKVVDQREHSGYLALVFNDLVVLRFKKFRDDGLGTCSIATDQQQQFAMQAQPLPGIRTATNLVAGYQLNELETGISMVAITCSVGDKVLWVTDITDVSIARDEAQRLQNRQPGAPTIRSVSDAEDDVRESQND